MEAGGHTSARCWLWAYKISFRSSSDRGSGIALLELTVGRENRHKTTVMLITILREYIAALVVSVEIAVAL